MTRRASFFLHRIKGMDFDSSAVLPSVGGTICLVEDDPSMLKALDRLLSAVGFQAQLFHEPLGFLSYVSCHSVALAVIGIWMPGVSGLETQQRLQTASPKTRVTIITADDDAWMRNAAIRAGAIAFFVKPFAVPLAARPPEAALMASPFVTARMTLAPPPIIKGQFGLPESFGTDPCHVWYNVLAA